MAHQIIEQRMVSFYVLVMYLPANVTSLSRALIMAPLSFPTRWLVSHPLSYKNHQYENRSSSSCLIEDKKIKLHIYLLHTNKKYPF